MRFGEQETVIEFDGHTAPLEGADLLRALTVEKMHLASAACWWRPPEVPVAHLPETVADLNRWIIGCVTYLRQEASRCCILLKSE